MSSKFNLNWKHSGGGSVVVVVVVSVLSFIKRLSLDHGTNKGKTPGPANSASRGVAPLGGGKIGLQYGTFLKLN